MKCKKYRFTLYILLQNTCFCSSLLTKKTSIFYGKNMLVKYVIRSVYNN